ncbi:MAG: adenylate kinase [Cyanobacteria bacterium J06626_14]
MQFIFLGSPGAGKGTQASILAERWRIPHISTGDILRTAIANRTRLGIKAETYVKTGKLVPNSLITAMLRERFDEPDVEHGWILDGFPRTLVQDQILSDILAAYQQPCPQIVWFEVPVEALVVRMLDRGRQDGTEAIIRRRFQVYQDDTAPLLGFYEQQGRLIKVDGNRSPHHVTQSLENALLVNQHSQLVSV